MNYINRIDKLEEELEETKEELRRIKQIVKAKRKGNVKREHDASPYNLSETKFRRRR